MTESEALEILGQLEIHFQKEIAAPTRQAWVEYLVRYDYEAGVAAVTKLATSTRFFPSLAEIIEAIGTGDLPSPAEAWGEILSQVRFVGSYGRPSFSHPAIANTVASVGWRAICMSDEDDWRFGEYVRRTYASYAERYTREFALGKLDAPAGISELAEVVTMELPAPEPSTDIGPWEEVRAKAIERRREAEAPEWTPEKIAEAKAQAAAQLAPLIEEEGDGGNEDA